VLDCVAVAKIENAAVQPEVQRIIDLIERRAGQFANARLNSKHEFNSQVIVGDYLIFVESVQSSSPIRVSVGVGWSIDPRTRDWDDDDRQVTSHRFVLLDGAWNDIVSQDRWSEDDIAGWAVAELRDWIVSNGKRRL
jgi:hypothetical protein